MALIGAAWVLAAIALASSIYWAAALAPPDSAPGVVLFAVAFVGAVSVASATSFAVARQRGRTSLAPLVFAAVITVAVSEEGAMLAGGIWPLTLLLTLALCAYSAKGLDRLRVLQQPPDAD